MILPDLYEKAEKAAALRRLALITLSMLMEKLDDIENPHRSREKTALRITKDIQEDDTLDITDTMQKIFDFLLCS